MRERSWLGNEKGWMKVKDWKNRGSHTKPIGYGAAT